MTDQIEPFTLEGVVLRKAQINTEDLSTPWNTYQEVALFYFDKTPDSEIEHPRKIIDRFRTHFNKYLNSLGIPSNIRFRQGTIQIETPKYREGESTSTSPFHQAASTILDLKVEGFTVRYYSENLVVAITRAIGIEGYDSILTDYVNLHNET